VSDKPKTTKVYLMVPVHVDIYPGDELEPDEDEIRDEAKETLWVCMMNSCDTSEERGRGLVFRWGRHDIVMDTPKFMPNAATASKLKMVKVEYEDYYKTYTTYINPKEVSEVFEASYDEKYAGIMSASPNDPKKAKSKIRMRNGDRVYSGKDPAELIAEIEAAANE
jgi:hypothetical protein